VVLLLCCAVYGFGHCSFSYLVGTPGTGAGALETCKADLPIQLRNVVTSAYPLIKGTTITLSFELKSSISLSNAGVAIHIQSSPLLPKDLYFEDACGQFGIGEELCYLPQSDWTLYEVDLPIALGVLLIPGIYCGYAEVLSSTGQTLACEAFNIQVSI